MDQLSIIMRSIESSWGGLQNYLPRLLGALAVLIFGWLCAKALSAAVSGLLRMIRFNLIAEKSGIQKFLNDGDVQKDATTLVSLTVYWLGLVTVILAALNVLGLTVAAELFNKIVLFIPNVILSTIVLIFGALFAKFARSSAVAYLKNIGMARAELLAGLTQYAILAFVVSIALEQLNIGGQILVSAIQIAFGSLCLGLALAFGLGGKDVAARALDRFFRDDHHPRKDDKEMLSKFGK
jgi:hypothetical protein